MDMNIIEVGSGDGWMRRMWTSSSMDSTDRPLRREERAAWTLDRE